MPKPVHDVLEVQLDEYVFWGVLFFCEFADVPALEIGADFYRFIVIIVFCVGGQLARVSELLIKFFSKESYFEFMRRPDNR